MPRTSKNEAPIGGGVMTAPATDAVTRCVEGLLRFLETPDVGEEAARLGREEEAFGRPARPALEGLVGGLPVERHVELDGVEPLRVPLEPARLRHAAGVEALTPVAVLPARRPDEDRHDRTIARATQCPDPPWASPAHTEHADR